MNVKKLISQKLDFIFPVILTVFFIMIIDLGSLVNAQTNDNALPQGNIATNSNTSVSSATTTTASAAATANIKLIPRHTYIKADLQTYSPTQKLNLDCDLTKFQNVTYTHQSENQFNTENISRSSTNVSLFETSNLTCLKKFGIVQYIKGCVYNSQLNPITGEIKRWFGHARSSRGQTVPFIHTNWEIDSVDIDPLYWSSTNLISTSAETNDLRLESYLSPLKNWQFQKEESALWEQYISLDHPHKFFMTLSEKPQPQFPILITTDLPVSSNFSYDEATNVSLQFQTCIYELEKIPLTGDPVHPEFSRSEGGPIHCFQWSHNHIFNHQLKKFEEFKEIDPYCPQVIQNNQK